MTYRPLKKTNHGSARLFLIHIKQPTDGHDRLIGGSIDLRQNEPVSRSLNSTGPKFFGFHTEEDTQMLKFVKSAALVGAMAGALALGGCATQEAVEHAQATADHAMSAAQSAGAAAQHAQSTADGAASAAAAAAADATKANTRLDTAESNLDHLMHHHEDKTWTNRGVKHKKHGHNMPSTGTENPAPPNTK